MNQNKRIVIIEGDAFDADAIVAISKFIVRKTHFGVHVQGKEPFEYARGDEATRDKAMVVAVDAWRLAVGYVMSIPTPSEPLPDQPPPLSEVRYWSDEKGRYYETYGGNTIYHDATMGKFIWNMGPPMRKNPLGPGASPIVRIYVEASGKVLDPQPV